MPVRGPGPWPASGWAGTAHPTEGGTIITNPDEHTTDVKSDLPWLVLTIEEAAEVLRIGRTTMFALVRDGEIRSFLIGRSRRIPLAAIDEYVRRKGAEFDQTDVAA